MLSIGEVEAEYNRLSYGTKPLAGLLSKHVDDDASEVLQGATWSVLGDVVYPLITQARIAAYIVALRRKTESPQIIHMQRLNALESV